MGVAPSQVWANVTNRDKAEIQCYLLPSHLNDTLLNPEPISLNDILLDSEASTLRITIENKSPAGAAYEVRSFAFETTTNTAQQGCLPGYKSVLCNSCAEDYFRETRNIIRGEAAVCEQCGDVGYYEILLILITILVILLMLIGAMMFLSHRQKMLLEDVSDGTTAFVVIPPKAVAVTKVVVSSMQVLTLMGSTFVIPFPPLFLHFLRVMKLFSFNFEFLDVKCMVPYNLYTTYIVHFAVCLVVLPFIAWGASTFTSCRSHGRKSRDEKNEDEAQEEGMVCE